MADGIYGRTLGEWEDLRDAAEQVLVTAARNRDMIDYGTLNRAIAEETGQRPFEFQLPSDRAAIGRLLGEISRASEREHGVMLSALVTHRGSNDEGSGFYKLAAELGKMPARPTADQKLEALVRLTNEVYERYGRLRRSYPLTTEGDSHGACERG